MLGKELRTEAVTLQSFGKSLYRLEKHKGKPTPAT